MGGGQVCGPQDTTPVMWNNVFARFERITLEHGRFTNSKSRSDEDWLTGLYQIKLEKPWKGQPFTDYTFLLLPVRRTSVFHQVLHIRESYLRRITPFIFSSRMTITSTRSSVILTSARRTLF